MITLDAIGTEVRNIQTEVLKRVVAGFDRAEEYVEGLRPVLHDRVNDMRAPVVNFVTSTVDSALEIRERGENLAATMQRDAVAMRKTAEGWVKKFIRA